jgi:hypothetical protein
MAALAQTSQDLHSHEEGCDRIWNVLTKELLGENGKVKGISQSR